MKATRPAVLRAAVAGAALALLAGCGAVMPPATDATWVPKPEGPPPADAPQPGAPGLDPNDPAAPDGRPPPPGSAGDVNVVATGLRLPWGLAVLPDGTALVGERRTGRILQVQPRRGVPARQVMRISGLDASGDGGLLDLALSPSYREDRLIFAYLTTRTDNRVVRFQIGGRPTPVLTGIPRGRVDNGGRLAFDADGLLYVGTGDAGHPTLAADKHSLAGKVLRITAFGGPALGNPDPASLVYSRGHKDVTGLCRDSGGRLIVTEPGTRADEVNQVTGGRDYGWPRASGMARRAGLVDPARTLAPATAGPGGCAVLERGLFVTALRGARLWALPLDSQGLPGPPLSLLDHAYGRLRTVVAAPDGALWLTTSNRDGAGRPVAADDRVIRIVPPAATTNSPA
jgi:glucose/arabinose dehydrogenase